jgi:4-hydroxy-tetrahydrodipicolinate synthase
VNILPETVAAIAAEPNVAAVKEASGNLAQIERMCDETGLQVYSGDDGLNMDILRLGARGAISVLSNLVPRNLVRMWESWRDGDAAAADILFAASEPLVEACFRETNPVPTKELLSIMGVCTNETRLPLVPALPENRAWLREFHDTTLAPLLEEE